MLFRVKVAKNKFLVPEDPASNNGKMLWECCFHKSSVVTTVYLIDI